MILTYSGRQLFEVKLTHCSAIDTNDPARYFSSSEQLLSYLKKRPNKKFALSAVIQDSFFLGYNQPEVEDEIDKAYGPHEEDIFCGDEVYYDSQLGRVRTFTRERIWGG